MTKCWESRVRRPFLTLTVAVKKTKRAERGASEAASRASQSVSPPPTRAHCPIKVLRSSLCAQARCHKLPGSKQSRWGEVNLTLQDPDRRRCVMPPALTLHHLWVGTGAWAHGYKRPDEVWSRLPDPSPPLSPAFFLLCLDQLPAGKSARISLSVLKEVHYTCFGVAMQRIGCWGLLGLCSVGVEAHLHKFPYRKTRNIGPIFQLQCGAP